MSHLLIITQNHINHLNELLTHSWFLFQIIRECYILLMSCGNRRVGFYRQDKEIYVACGVKYREVYEINMIFTVLGEFIP